MPRINYEEECREMSGPRPSLLNLAHVDPLYLRGLQTSCDGFRETERTGRTFLDSRETKHSPGRSGDALPLSALAFDQGQAGLFT